MHNQLLGSFAYLRFPPSLQSLNLYQINFTGALAIGYWRQPAEPCAAERRCYSLARPESEQHWSTRSKRLGSGRLRCEDPFPMSISGKTMSYLHGCLFRSRFLILMLSRPHGCKAPRIIGLRNHWVPRW